MSDDISIKLMMGKLLSKTLEYKSSIQDVEFSVFSQFGDDGIIQFLVETINPVQKFFVEFGVENYLESNTRFLLQNNNWSGLVLDGSKTNIENIRRQDFYWKHDITAIASFITAENINGLLRDVPADAGLLHIDIDGNDYWIWKALQVVAPEIVIMEYNSVLGCDRAITVPYHPAFVRQDNHHSYLYAGASLLALCDLANEKGYDFVGTNNAGNNAYFVRKDKVGTLRSLTAAEGYTESKFREARDKKGNLTFARAGERLEIIRGLPVFNTRSQTIEKI